MCNASLKRHNRGWSLAGIAVLLKTVDAGHMVASIHEQQVCKSVSGLTFSDPWRDEIEDGTVPISR
jgi:hypothetical protein